MKAMRQIILALTMAALSVSVACEKSEKTDAETETEKTSETTEETAQTAEEEEAVEEEETAAEEAAATKDNEPAGDLPTYSIPNASHPFGDKMMTAGQPSEKQFELLKDDYSTVINLRMDRELTEWDEELKARELGMEYVHIPIGGGNDLTRENAKRFAEALEQAEKSDGKVLVHCGSSNRVGALFALKRAWIDGESKEEAIAAGKKAGLSSLTPIVEKKLSDGE